MRNAAELLRLIHNLIRLGKVTEVDQQAAICRVKIGALETKGLKWISTRAGTTRDWDPPTVGEQVVVFAPGGDLSAAVVLAGLYQQSHGAPASSGGVWQRDFPDGAQLQYDHENHAADVTLPAGGTLNLVSDGGIGITGNVQVTGSIAASGEVSDGVRSMSDDRDIYNAHKHPGDSGGTTGTPDSEQ